MQKFLFVFLAFVAVFVALVPSVEGAALGRQTNAERLARGMKPLPPVKRSKTEGASELGLRVLAVIREAHIRLCKQVRSVVRSRPSSVRPMAAARPRDDD
jgi:hypothetical protein